MTRSKSELKIDRASAEAMRQTYVDAPASLVASLARRAHVAFFVAFEALSGIGPFDGLKDLVRDRIERVEEIERKTGLRARPEWQAHARYRRERAAFDATFLKKHGEEHEAPRRPRYPTESERIVGARLSAAHRRTGRVPPPSP